LAEGLKGTNKPLIITSGSGVVAADPKHGETTESSPINENPAIGRIKCEEHALALVKMGINVMAVRLAPFVYGRGGSGISLFLGMSQAKKEVIYVGEGSACISAVHVDDAARLYLLVAKHAKAGEIFNGTSSTKITHRQIAEAMAGIVNLPTRSVTLEEAAAKFGRFLANFLSMENRASNAKAVNTLGWHPREQGILEDILNGSYVAVAEALQKRAS